MSKDRKAKLKKREQKERRAEQRKHGLIESALKNSGMASAFRRLPPFVQEFFHRYILPAPELIIDPSAAACPEIESIQGMFGAIMNSRPRLFHEDMTPMEVYRFLGPLNNTLQNWEQDFLKKPLTAEKSPWPEIRAFAPLLRDYMQAHQTNVIAYFYAYWSFELLDRSRFDERVFWYELAHRLTPSGKVVQQVVLKMTKPEQIRFNLDGLSRPAYRCCLLDCPAGLKLLSFTSQQLGLAGEARDFPVYLQSHVLEQLKRRIPNPNFLSLVSSLLNPKFTSRPDGAFLVEYRVGVHRLGYFVGERLGERVLLKTFLFLTMQGTPESDQLYHKLRLTRRDIEYMSLDNLTAFTHSDLRDDPALVKLFQECGCGHLLTANLTSKNINPTGRFAEGLRKYLGDIDAVTRRLEQSARAAQLRGGLDSDHPFKF